MSIIRGPNILFNTTAMHLQKIPIPQYVTGSKIEDQERQQIIISFEMGALLPLHWLWQNSLIALLWQRWKLKAALFMPGRVLKPAEPIQRPNTCFSSNPCSCHRAERVYYEGIFPMCNDEPRSLGEP